MKKEIVNSSSSLGSLRGRGAGKPFSIYGVASVDSEWPLSAQHGL